MDPIALYYPYIHVQDDTWLKYASLYWPKMGRLRPADYLTVDSRTARVLHDEARWLIDVPPPSWAAREVGAPFSDLIRRHRRELKERYGVGQADDWERMFHLDRLSRKELRSKFGFTWVEARRASTDIHIEKLWPQFVGVALDAGLATISRDSMWVTMHPKLASVYMCALTECIATQDFLHPLTDQLLPHAALSGWTLDRIAQVLIDLPTYEFDRSSPERNLSDAFVFMAFETVAPANLDKVPIEKIIEFRSRFGVELDTYRKYVGEQAQKLARLENVRDFGVFEEYLRSEVQHSVNAQLAGLRERMRSVGLEAARAVMDVKSVGMPSLVDMVAELTGMPRIIRGPAVLAACIVSAPSRWRRNRRQDIRESPVGYLFRIQNELNPTTLIDRLRQAWPNLRRQR
ncbi:DUF6236 family protein [Pseudonocardia acaciae]|uniref:DUF6236 family protein n=1 Tax=Pseudonocardia acaciae TaxID=551276 RepID=UPI0012ED2729|nr:DUF6236 family protein [Pseudonocardia acaciae]